IVRAELVGLIRGAAIAERGRGGEFDYQQGHQCDREHRGQQRDTALIAGRPAAYHWANAIGSVTMVESLSGAPPGAASTRSIAIACGSCRPGGRLVESQDSPQILPSK